MSTTHSDEEQSPAYQLGSHLRVARKQNGWTIAELAEKIGRPREWLNRVELGHSEWGEHRPPSKADLKVLIDKLGGQKLEVPAEKLLELRDQSEKEFDSYKQGTSRSRRNFAGKLTQAEVIIGESQLYDAAEDLLNAQHSDAIIRNTGIWSLAPSYLKPTQEWETYRKVIGRFLAEHPNSMLKRVEYVGTAEHLDLAKESDKWSAGDRSLSRVHNAKVKFLVRNPLLMDVLIGQREAILALPQSTSRNSSNIAILVRDKLFVEALRVWFDEVLWEYPVDGKLVDYRAFDKSFDQIKQMYGF